MNTLLTSLKLTVATLLVCSAAYPLIILGFAQTAVHETANGSLLRNPQGIVIGSRLIAQKFTSPRYLWPRPSAADYNAGAAAGSNLAPSSPKLADRAREFAAAHGASTNRPLPADLATASGSGLDPHITENAARFQAARVAAARGLPPDVVTAEIHKRAFAPGGPMAPVRVVNVLEVNLALDTLSSGR